MTKPKRTHAVTDAVRAGLAKARAARAAKADPVLKKALKELANQRPMKTDERKSLDEFCRSEFRALTELSLDEVMGQAMQQHPEMQDYVTCWQVAQLGIALPPCSMDEADAALKRAQMRHRVTVTGEQTFVHSADLGDIIAALPVIRAMGGGKLIITELPQGPFHGRESLRGARFDSLKPLLELQPYITSVEWGESPFGVIDFRGFRHGLPGGENLTVSQARHVGCEDFSFSKWLDVPDPIPGPAVFARSPRYWQPRMNWSIMYAKHPDAVFVGTENEHAEFQKATNITLPHRKTKDLLELARVIAGCERLFCNQSCPLWIGFGLEHPLVLEVSMENSIQNSIIDNPKFFYIGNQTQAGRGNWR
jgi:hypothetical protein